MKKLIKCYNLKWKLHFWLIEVFDEVEGIDRHWICGSHWDFDYSDWCMDSIDELIFNYKNVKYAIAENNKQWQKKLIGCIMI